MVTGMKLAATGRNSAWQLGVIPGAVRKNGGTYQDAIIMFRSLES